MLNLDTQSTQNKSTLINRRMFILSISKVVIFAGIIGKLFSLQVSENKKYKTLSDKNRIREWKLAPKRGLIRDYFDNVIVDNAQVYQLHIVPENVVDFKILFFKLRKILNLEKSQIIKLEKKIKSQKPFEPVVVSNNLSWSDFSKLNLFLHELSGVELVVSVARKYLQNEIFAHTIGYVGAVSAEEITTNEVIRKVNVSGLKVGKTGLEKALNENLIGTAGFQRYEVNAYGKRIKEIKLSEGKRGTDFKTTLDIEVQKFANELLISHSGSICVMDIFSGDIIAMVSSPTFNPNRFVHGISSKEWKSLISNNKKPLINKSISGLYPPGSTIKPIVALSALEFDVISTKLVVECKGSMEMHGQKYHCWKKKGHGFMGLKNAIKQSCDIYFYEVARRLGIDRMSITAKRFGLGQKILPDFIEEKKGIVPDVKWKLKNKGRGWVLGETLISGIGQGYFQATPLQLCLMTAQLANNGFKVKPRIIEDGTVSYEDIEEFKKQAFEKRENKNVQEGLINSDSFNLGRFKSLFRNQENIKFVKDAMFSSTNEVLGTSFRSRHKDKEYIYAGKTGTSQIKKITEEQRELEIKNEDLDYEDRDHALFIAFAPYKNPRYALSVVIEHGGSGSSTAAPIAKKLIKKIIDRDKLRQKYYSETLKEI